MPFEPEGLTKKKRSVFCCFHNSNRIEISTTPLSLTGTRWQSAGVERKYIFCLIIHSDKCRSKCEEWVQGGGACVHSRALLHQTITPVNTEITHLVMWGDRGTGGLAGFSPKQKARWSGDIEEGGARGAIFVSWKCRRPPGPVMMVMWCVGDWLYAGCCHRAGTAL